MKTGVYWVKMRRQYSEDTEWRIAEYRQHEFDCYPLWYLAGYEVGYEASEVLERRGPLLPPE